MTIYFLKFPLENTLAGAEFHTLQLAKHFTMAGHDVRLVSSDKKLLSLFQKHSLRQKYMFAGWEPTSFFALLLWPITFFLARKRFKTLLKNISPGSVFFLQSLTEKILFTPLAQKIHRVIWLEHKIPGRWLWKNPLLSQYLKLSKNIQTVTVSNFAKNEFIKLGLAPDNIQVIYPGIKSTTYPPASEAGNIQHTTFFTIGLLSRLDPEKGVYTFLINILPTLRNHPDWQVRIAGEGREMGKIKNFIDQEGLLAQVKLLGFVSSVEKFFHEISVLVYPTKARESFGIAVLEALSHGVPAIASNIGALPEIVEHGKTGFLVDFSKTEMINSLKQLENKNVYAQFASAGKSGSEKFSENTMFKSFDELVVRPGWTKDYLV